MAALSSILVLHGLDGKSMRPALLSEAIAREKLEHQFGWCSRSGTSNVHTLRALA